MHGGSQPLWRVDNSETSCSSQQIEDGRGRGLWEDWKVLGAPRAVGVAEDGGRCVGGVMRDGLGGPPG